MDRRKIMLRISASVIIAAMVFAILPSQAAAYTYDRQDAVDYALDNWNENVPGSWWFNMNDGDCTNFVSWCLYEGGWTKQDPQWYSYWPYWTGGSHSNSWTCSGAFGAFAQSRGDRIHLGYNRDTVIATTSSLVSSGGLQEGDIIQRVSPGHTMIITGTAGSTAFVTYHTPNTYYENFRYFVNSHNQAEYVAYHLDATG